jgi:hypothetical protein
LVRKASGLVQNAAVMPMRYVYPLDPQCPVVAEFMETLFGDPTTMAIGAPLRNSEREQLTMWADQVEADDAYGG